MWTSSNIGAVIAALVLTPSIALHAAVVVSDQGLTPPIGFDTGYTGATGSRTSVDAGETFSQTFQVPDSGLIDSIWIGYNDFTSAGSGVIRIAVDTDNNGSNDFTSADLPVSSADFQTDGNDTGLFYWMRFDFSGESVSLIANQTASWSVIGVSETGTDNFIFALRFAEGNPYALGASSLGATRDQAFAVFVQPTVIPAPLTLPAGLALLAMTAMRRRR